MQNELIQNTGELRSQNRKKILNALRQNGQITKREIAAYTSLSFAAVSSLVNQMIEESLITRKGMSASHGGRSSALLELRSDTCFFLAINLAISGELRMALMTLDDQCAFEWSENIRISDGYDVLLELVVQGLTRLLQAAQLEPAQILGVAAAVPALYDQESRRIVNSTIPLYEGHLLADDLCQILGMEVSVENEANLMALACCGKSGQGNAAEDLLFLYAGEGLGAGITRNGKVFSGFHGYGGEIGHIPLGHAGYSCYCGKKNCVETELSIQGFIRKYNSLASEHSINKWQPLFSQWQAFVASALSGNSIALSVIKENGQLMGVLISLLVNLLDPQEVIIGGYIDEIGELMLPSVYEELTQRLTVPRKDNIPIRFVKGYNHLIFKGCGKLAFTTWTP